jgi:hypothetical protein
MHAPASSSPDEKGVQTMSAQESYLCHLLNTRAVPRLLLFTLMASILVLVSTAANAQTVPSWVGHLLLENSTITADPTLTAPEAQGLGLKFELLFAMVNNQDPQNVDNDVISVLTTTAYPAGIGVAVRDMLPKAKIETLTNQISLKYLFVPTRTCSGGSPRIQLFIDPGDGTSPHNAFGYVGNAPFGAGCISDGNWHFQDMTDDVARWDLSQWFSRGAACDMTCTWTQVVAFFHTAFPNHVVLSGGVFDDSCSFSATACGQAYYDLVTVENRTLENREDTVQGPTQ